jgi:hypothetical protein
MPSYRDQADLAVLVDFNERSRIKLLDYALTINDESVGGIGEPTEAEHALRLALARRIVNNPMGYGEILAYALVADGTLTSISDDADILTQITTLFTTIATLA